MKGKFITLEGCEGVGKSTQLALLKKYLEENNIPYIFTREPGGTPIAEKIRGVILDANNKEMTNECEALLYASARAQHVSELILPALKEGKLVLCDRYIDSSFAYQAYARGLGIDYISKINSYAIDNCMPDYTIFLDLSPKDAFLRKGGADKNDRIEQTGMDFHLAVYKGYKELEKRHKDRFISVDCSGEKLNTHNNIIKALKEKGII